VFFFFVHIHSSCRSGEGFSAVIESVEAGLGAPDPHQLAEMNRMAFKIKGETSLDKPTIFVMFRTRNSLETGRRSRFSEQSRRMAECLEFGSIDNHCQSV
jgi:hypothetical protein